MWMLWEESRWFGPRKSIYDQPVDWDRIDKDRGDYIQRITPEEKELIEKIPGPSELERRIFG